jgi:hypothetical protein
MRTFRAYFNKRGQLPWSVDEGTQETEVNVTEFVITEGCRAESRFTGEKPNDHNPVAWIEITAIGFVIQDQVACFLGEPLANAQLP